MNVRNVVGYVPGAGPRANEHLVIGAHYDHLGLGGMASFQPTTRAIHNGADDNASGTTALIQLADRFANGPPPQRSILFVAFTAEEQGLLGADHFVDHPPVPLSDIVAMINFDMVGRMTDDTLHIGGNGTAPAFGAMLNKVDAESPLKLKDMGKGGLGPSDHMAFAQKKIPVLHFFSGLHSDYHRPSDDTEKINFKGLDQIVDFAAAVMREVISMPRQTYDSKHDSHSAGPGTPSRSRVTLGVIPDYGDNETGGAKISGTTPDSPAAKAGLTEGDIIVKFGDSEIGTLYDLSEALSSAKPGQTVKLKIRRGDKTVEIEATLAERK
ncbi:MAG: M28 family peptidase [Gemmatimonadaceae bacterium]|nr:M28 family peptidase [Gemmatimonadaceae bacterium]